MKLSEAKIYVQGVPNFYNRRLKILKIAKGNQKNSLLCTLW